MDLLKPEQIYHLSCPSCGKDWWDDNPFPSYCPFAVSNSAAGDNPGGCFFGGDASGNSYVPDRYDCWLPGWRLPSRPGGGEPYQQ